MQRWGRLGRLGDQITGHGGWGCKGQEPPGLDCLSHEVVSLSRREGSSRDRRTDLPCPRAAAPRRVRMRCPIGTEPPVTGAGRTFPVITAGPQYSNITAAPTSVSIDKASGELVSGLHSGPAFVHGAHCKCPLCPLPQAAGEIAGHGIFGVSLRDVAIKPHSSPSCNVGAFPAKRGTDVMQGGAGRGVTH